MKIYISTFLSLIIIVPSISFAEEDHGELILNCDMNGGGITTFLLDPESGKATLVLPESAVSGQLTQSKEHYTLTFPKTKKQMGNKGYC